MPGSLGIEGKTSLSAEIFLCLAIGWMSVGVAGYSLLLSCGHRDLLCRSVLRGTVISDVAIVGMCLAQFLWG